METSLYLIELQKLTKLFQYSFFQNNNQCQFTKVHWEFAAQISLLWQLINQSAKTLSKMTILIDNTGKEIRHNIDQRC